MFSFRQKIFFSYLAVFLIFAMLLFPYASQFVNRVVKRAMEDRTTELIEMIKDAPNNESLILTLKEQKPLIFFRVSVITNEYKVLYDSHVKSLLGSEFSQDYVIHHPEVIEAFKNGSGFIDDYSNLFGQKFSYYAKTFDFHGKTYVLRTAFPYQYILQLTHEVEIGFLLSVAGVLLLFSLFTWLIINHLTQPIQKIIQTIKPYQEGLVTDIPEMPVKLINNQDEFGKLATTLNSLSLKIKNHINSLTDERNEKKATLESLIEGVIAINDDGIVTYANNTAFKLLGLTQEKIINHHINDIPLPDCQQLIETCQREGRVLTSSFQLIREGQKIYIDLVAAPKKDKGGAVLVLQDKTSYYKMQEMRKDFVANASHELKTPITIIRGFAETLHDNPDLPKETTVNITNKIVQNCIRMATLIKDLLTLADIENLPSSRLIKCDLYDIVQNCRSTILTIFPDTEIQIITASEEDMTLLADASLMELAITNLIENAAKYSSKPAKIIVSLKKSLEEITVTITDQGIGIPKEDLEHIFERFYTVNKAHSRKLGGSGLGLSIVQTVVQKHGGTIEVVSQIDHGTTFTLFFPIKTMDEKNTI